MPTIILFTFWSWRLCNLKNGETGSNIDVIVKLGDNKRGYEYTAGSVW